MKSAEAVMRSQPEIPLTVFQNCLNPIIRQAVLRCESREGPSASVQLVEAVPSANPKQSLPVFPDSIHTVVAQAANVMGVMAIDGELLRLGVKTNQSGKRRQPQDSSSILEYGPYFVGQTLGIVGIVPIGLEPSRL